MQPAFWLDYGFRLFQAPTDMGFMTAGARAYLEPLGRWGEKVKAKTIY